MTAAARTVAAAPVPNRTRVVRLPAGAAGLRLVECAVGLIAVGLALGMFGGFYDGVSWLPWLVGTAVLTGAVVGFALLREARWWTATVVVVVLVLGCAHTAGYGQLGWYGLPTVRSLRGLATGLTSGLPKMLAVGLPANAGGDLVVLPLLLAGAAGAGTVALLLRTRW